MKKPPLQFTYCHALHGQTQWIITSPSFIFLILKICHPRRTVGTWQTSRYINYILQALAVCAYLLLLSSYIKKWNTFLPGAVKVGGTRRCHAEAVTSYLYPPATPPSAIYHQIPLGTETYIWYKAISLLYIHDPRNCYNTYNPWQIGPTNQSGTVVLKNNKIK
jgi:hypothetical protein